MTREPVVVINSIVAVVVAIVAALVTGGALQISTEQQQMLEGIVVAIGAFVATFLARSQVTPISDPRDASGKSLS